MRSENIGQWTINAVQQALDRLVRNITLAVEGRVKVTAADTQPSFLDVKIAPGRGLTRTVLNPGAVEQYQLDAIGAEHELIVDPSGNFDETSIAVAITAAIAGGASAADPWLVTVKSGVYTEPPMTVPAGVAVVSLANRIDTVFVVAQNATSDLFTCTGGYLAGMSLSGVSDASHALIRCATASSLVVMHGVSWRGCSTGVVVENGATAVLTNCSMTINGPGQAIGTGIICRTGSVLQISGFFASVPAAVLALYPGINPIQTAIYINGGDATISTLVCHVAYNVGDNDGIYADDGAFVTVFSADVEDCFFATRIGPDGANTKMIIQGATFFNCDWNGYAASSTGLYQVSGQARLIKFFAVAGATLNGLIQTSDDGKTLLAGTVNYLYASGKDVHVGEFFSEFGSSCLAEDGNVTDAGGLFVDVEEGEGYSVRPTPDHDIDFVTWAAAASVALTPNATNYVHYDPVSETIQSSVAPLGQAEILLATAVTDGAGIRFLHKTRNLVNQPDTTLHDYLLMTRKIAWTSGLGVAQGSTAVKLDVNSGSWYVATELVSSVGGADVTFSYFYGPAAATEVSGVTDLSVTQYDNAGVLTGMTGGYFRADTVIVTSDSRISVIYGTSEFLTQVLAEDKANKASIPTIMSDTGCHAALVVVEQGVGIASVIDIRPNPNAATAGGGGGAAPSDHSALLNLLSDVHTQYLLVSGARAMAGNLNMGTQNVTNVGTVDGVDVSGHAARHEAGGLDELAVATPLANGYLSAADKTKLDAIVAPAAQISESAVPTTTASGVDVLMAGMTFTPTAGTYAVFFSADIGNTNDKKTVSPSIYVGGLRVAASERPIRNEKWEDSSPYTGYAIAVVNGVQTIQGRWRTDGNTATSASRQLMIMRVA